MFNKFVYCHSSIWYLFDLTHLYVHYRNVLKSREPVYQAIWADSTDFDEVLISPVMVQDHMPYKILAALKKVITDASDDTSSVNSTINLNSRPQELAHD